MNAVPKLAPQAVTVLTFRELDKAAAALAAQVRAWVTTHVQKGVGGRPVRLYGVPRGGVPAAYLLARHMQPLPCELVGDPDAADVLVDDLIDSGRTRERYARHGKPFFALYDKAVTPGWLVFPWEGGEQGSADDIPIRLLQYIGEDPTREGLEDTPRRFLAAWKEWTRGYTQEEKLTVFAGESYDEMVLVKDIPVYSHCEHHLAPFFGKAHVAYIPHGKIVGLSKIPRLVQVFMRRLQVQERLTMQIAHALQEALEPLGVGVVLECRHMCMESRGVKTPGTYTTTSRLLGFLKDRPEARAEFLRLIEGAR
jgi:GTP cyclohydrolase I